MGITSRELSQSGVRIFLVKGAVSRVAALDICYVVTAWQAHQFHDVANGNIKLCSKSAKQRSRLTVVKLTSAYLEVDTRLRDRHFKY